MTRYGESYKLNDNDLEAIAVYMNDEIREELHNRLAPCTNETFLTEYVKRDPAFEELLKSEFSIEL